MNRFAALLLPLLAIVLASCGTSTTEVPDVDVDVDVGICVVITMPEGEVIPCDEYVWPAPVLPVPDEIPRWNCPGPLWPDGCGDDDNSDNRPPSVDPQPDPPSQPPVPPVQPPGPPEDCKPGWGHGDPNHCHSGPPGRR